MAHRHDDHNHHSPVRPPRREQEQQPAPPVTGLPALQRLAGNQAVNHLIAQRRMAPSPGVEDVTRGDIDDVLRGGGKPLDAPLKAKAEGALGMDLSHVRVHTGTDASASAASLSAKAYTVGRDVVVGEGGNTPETLLHELKHVQQQAAGPVPGTQTAGGLQLSDPGDHAEREASDFGARAARTRIEDLES